ncbi:MAG: TonB-dependent receptor [Opitutales bacterium]|nr:TonB-dependent receptor [Opitutales bacterium]
MKKSIRLPQSGARSRENLVKGLSALLLSAGPVLAQTESTNEDIYILDPFTVSSDFDGYKALDTLGGARVRTTLADTAASLSVITPKLMQDLNVTSAEDLLVYTTNTEVSGLGGNFSGIASRGFGVASSGEDRRLVNPAGTNRSRGLSAMDNTRNYFRSEIPWDGYNISRVDISRGPNSFLFGVGSPSGISNVSTNDAAFNTFGNFEFHYGSYGTTRESFDYNHEVLKNELAVRVDLVNDEKQFKQNPAYNHSQRAYLALRYDPSFLDTETAHTKILFNYEYGDVSSNNPRMLPPMDYITGYLAEANGEGIDEFVYNPDASGADPNFSPWVASEDIHYAWGNTPTYWYDGATGQLIQAGQSNAGGYRYNSSTSVAGFGGIGNSYNVYSSGFRHYAEAVNANNPDLYPGADAGTVTYLDKTLSDPSIFDFYNNLIDGANKHEWQDWDVYNLSVVQSLFSDRLVIQAVATHEDYENGIEGALGGYVNPYIAIDLNAYENRYPSWYDEATENPNLGRPFIAGKYDGGNSSTHTIHDNYQLTANYSLRAEDLTSSDSLIQILGHHEFTGLVGRYVTEEENRKWAMYAASEAYSDRLELSPTLSNRSLSWVTYLGDSLIDSNSATGAYLSNINGSLTPASGNVTLFDRTWTATGVDPNAVWIYQIPGQEPSSLTQIDNPANYSGYQPYAMSVVDENLYSSGDKSKETLESYAFMYQGFLFNDAVIPSFGWRRDKVRQQGSNAPIDSNTNIASMDYELEDEGVRISTTSVSYGIAVHLAKIFKNLLPENDDITLYYFHGSNQTPKVRYAIDTSMLPNEEGETDDFSIQYDGFNGRFTVRLTYFKTIDKYASASYGQPLGASGWLIDSLPSWTVGFAASALYAVDHPDSEMPNDLLWQSWLWQWGRDNPDLVAEVGEVMRNEFSDVFTQEYWDLYNLPVDAAAIRAGDWLNVLSNGSAPLPWNIANEHLIHGVHPVIDQDLEAKGFELEATVRPLSNWDITFNASRVEAYQTKLGERTSEYLESLADLYINSPLSQVAQWGNINSPLRDQFMSGLWGPYLTQLALTGSDQPEIRKWNFKVISNYTFNEGFMKGFNVGGAFRWADKPILGYGIYEGEMFGESAWMIDVNKPYYGSTDSHFDFWVGYQRALTEKIDWRIQLNLRNVGESSGLETIAVEPDGTVAQQRITQGMTYDLSMKFMF